MSKTQYVNYGDVGFWSYDVAFGIFLKHLIDAALAINEANAPWLPSALASWRTVACISDYGLTLDVGWSAAQRQTFITLAADAWQMLARRGSVTAEEIVSWPLLDDLRISPRGETEVFTAPVVELGRAIIALVAGELPQAPTGTAWFYTLCGRKTIGLRPRKLGQDSDISRHLHEITKSSYPKIQLARRREQIVHRPINFFQNPLIPSKHSLFPFPQPIILTADVLTQVRH